MLCLFLDRPLLGNRDNPTIALYVVSPARTFIHSPRPCCIIYRLNVPGKDPTINAGIITMSKHILWLVQRAVCEHFARKLQDLALFETEWLEGRANLPMGYGDFGAKVFRSFSLVSWGEVLMVARFGDLFESCGLFSLSPGMGCVAREVLIVASWGFCYFSLIRLTCDDFFALEANRAISLAAVELVGAAQSEISPAAFLVGCCRSEFSSSGILLGLDVGMRGTSGAVSAELAAVSSPKRFTADLTFRRNCLPSARMSLPSTVLGLEYSPVDFILGTDFLGQ